MSSLFSKSTDKSTGPYFSLNSDVTDTGDLGPAPLADEVAAMKNSDPKLEYIWAIWEQHKQPKHSKNVEYADCTRKTCTFSTATEFWACWNHLPQPSVLLDQRRFVRENGGSTSIVDCLMVFREGIQPEWEDPQNTNGGHFQLTLKPSLPPGQIDELWNNVVMGVISGVIEPTDMITGVRLLDKLDAKTKQHIRIELWFNDLDERKTYDLRGSFERCIRIGLDGANKPVTWGRTDLKPHKT